MINIPTLQEIKDSIVASIESLLGVKLPDSGRNFFRIISATLAAQLKLVYLSLGKVQKNVWVDTADPESEGGTLERFGRVKLNRNPFPARAGQYDVIVTGEVGSTIAAGTTFKSDDDSTNPGFLYVLDAEYELVATVDSIVLRALTTGLDSSLKALDTLTATAPIAGVDSEATVYAVVVEPLAAETIEEYRAIVVQAYRSETQGGSASDYRLWASDAQGVARTYPYATTNVSSQVDLFVEATAASSQDGKGTPSIALLNEVEEVVNFDPDETLPLEERGRRPLQVIVNLLPITVLKVDIFIANYQNLTPEKETLIQGALDALVGDIRPFVAAADILENKNDILDINKITAAIISVDPAAQFGPVTMEVDSNLVTTFTFSFGDIPNLNTINYV